MALHRLVTMGTKKEIFLEIAYSDWMDRIWSDGCGSRWCITLEDGIQCYDHGIVYKKSWQTAGNWPMASYAMGVSPSEVPDMKRRDAEMGVAIEYNSAGDPVFTSKSHRKAYCEAHGYFDRNAGYSDPVPANR